MPCGDFEEAQCTPILDISIPILFKMLYHLISLQNGRFQCFSMCSGVGYSYLLCLLFAPHASPLLKLPPSSLCILTTLCALFLFPSGPPHPYCLAVLFCLSAFCYRPYRLNTLPWEYEPSPHARETIQLIFLDPDSFTQYSFSSIPYKFYNSSFVNE